MELLIKASAVGIAAGLICLVIKKLFIAPVMKCAAIAIVTKLASELCRDSSQSAVASSVELAGSICALSVAMPLIISMLKTIGAMA